MKPDDVRNMVSKSYAEALKRSQQGSVGCCGPAAPAGVAAKTAGYHEELACHPEAAASSFGCGNPLAFSGVREGETVLDLGSGAGFDLLIAVEKVGPNGRVIGIDMTDEMIAAARGNAAKAGFTNVEVRKGLIEALPVDANSVDWVISNCVINLSPEKERVFAEMFRVLRPGGRFSISDIVAEGLPAAVLERAAAYAACVAGAISERDYVGGLEAAGMVDVEVTERLIYGADQIEAIVASDVANITDAEKVEPARAALQEVLRGIEGKVASVRVSGRKP